MRAATLEDYRARPREVLLPGLRGDHRGAGALTSDPARLRRAEPAGDGAGQQVPAASAVETARATKGSRSMSRHWRIRAAPAWWRSTQLFKLVAPLSLA